MACKVLTEEQVKSIEELVSKGNSKLSIATKLGFNYPRIERVLKLGGSPFTAEEYFYNVTEFNSEASANAIASRKNKSASTVPSTTATATEYHLHLTNPLYDFQTLQKTPKCDMKKFDWQEILRMYSCDEAPCPGHGLVLHDTEVLDKWCYNPNHAPTLTEAETVIRADYYCYEIFKSYGLATPRMYEFLKDE